MQEWFSFTPGCTLISSHAFASVCNDVVSLCVCWLLCPAVVQLTWSVQSLPVCMWPYSSLDLFTRWCQLGLIMHHAVADCMAATGITCTLKAAMCSQDVQGAWLQVELPAYALLAVVLLTLSKMCGRAAWHTTGVILPGYMSVRCQTSMPQQVGAFCGIGIKPVQAVIRVISKLPMQMTSRVVLLSVPGQAGC